MSEIIVAAALQILLPSVPTSIDNEPMVFFKPKPARHHHLIHQIAILTGVPVQPDEQGFITSEGRYVDRAEAMAIAFSEGQTMSTRKHLFSEDLW